MMTPAQIKQASNAVLALRLNRTLIGPAGLEKTGETRIREPVNQGKNRADKSGKRRQSLAESWRR